MTHHLDDAFVDRVSVQVPSRAFAHWDDGWRHEPGAFEVGVGTSVTDLSLEASIALHADLLSEPIRPPT